MRWASLRYPLKTSAVRRPFVLVDKLHQELLFLGVDFVNLRHESTHNRHDCFGGKEGFSLTWL